MVEVTKLNFETVLKDIFAAIRGADFVAIDTNVETTGFVMFDEVINPKIIEKGWYETILKKQSTRSALDFGIAIFKKESQKGDSTLSSSSMNRYTVRCYSIPIFLACVEEHDARSESRRLKLIERRQDFDNIGWEFIQRTRVDLNKIFYAGTPFMNREVQDESAGYMKENPTFMKISGKHITNGDLDQYYFPKLIDSLGQEDIDEILERLRGIGKFFDVTAENKIPIIGHNLLIKLIVLYKDFVEYLPNEYSEFLVKLEKVLPQFYDTKYMAWEIAQRSEISGLKKSVVQCNDLFELYRNVGWVGKNIFEFNLDEETDSTYGNDLEDVMASQLELESEGFCHESGFDACLSGMIFARLAYLVRDEDPKGGPFVLDDNFFRNQAKVWKNRMYLQDEIKTDNS